MAKLLADLRAAGQASKVNSKMQQPVCHYSQMFPIDPAEPDASSLMHFDGTPSNAACDHCAAWAAKCRRTCESISATARRGPFGWASFSGHANGHSAPLAASKS